MKSKFGLKASIILSSTDLMIAMALITPIIAYLAKQFPNAGPMLNLVLTLPMLFMVPMVIITGRLVKYFNKKPILIIGTLLFALGGIAGGFATDFGFMLFTRAIVGIGAGVLFVTPQLYTVQFFEGAERAQMMGFISAFGALFSVLFGILGGYFGVINWRLNFYTYAIFLLMVVAQIIFVPNTLPEGKDKKLKGTSGNDEHVSWGALVRTIALGLGALFSFALLGIFQQNISAFVIENNLGTSVEVGYAMSGLSIITFVFGLLFGRIFQLFKRYISVIIFAIISVCLFWVANTTSYVQIFMISLLLGLASSALGPYYSTRAPMTGFPKSKRSSAMTLILTFLFLGMFVGTLLIALFGKLFSPDLRTIYTVSGWFAGLCVIITFVYIQLTNRFEKPEGRIT